jgi:hypothetical protein
LAKNKVETFIGFCVKARKILLGQGSVDTAKSGVYLILVCSSASENTFKLALKYKNRFSCPLMICKCGLENAVNKPNCKIAAVKDERLASAIIDNACDDYELYAGGNN